MRLHFETQSKVTHFASTTKASNAVVSMRFISKTSGSALDIFPFWCESVITVTEANVFKIWEWKSLAQKSLILGSYTKSGRRFFIKILPKVPTDVVFWISQLSESDISGGYI